MKKALLILVIASLICSSAMGQLQVSITGNSSFCPGGQTCVTAVATGGTAPYTYLWSDATTSATDCISIAGFYSVTVTDALMDTTSTSIVITQYPAPTIAVTPPNPSVCPISNIGLTATGGLTYYWSPSYYLTCINCPNPIVYPYSTTTYTVTGTDGNGCSGSTTVTITVHPTDTAYASPSHICPGDSSVLWTSGGTDFIWSTGDTSASITVWPLFNTNYTVTINNTITGCTKVAYQHVYVGFSDQIYTNHTFLPAGDTATLIASGGTQYLWSTGDTTNTIHVAPQSTTTYWVTISAPPLTCAGIGSITIVVGMPKAGIVYRDLNCNSFHDPGEPVVPNKVISEQPVNYLFLSDSSGIYPAYYDTGFYNLQLLYPGNYCVVNPPTHTLTGLSDTNNHFGICCPPVLDVATTVTHGWLEPDSNTYFLLSYHNPGTTLASGSVHMVYDTLLNFLSANPPPSFQSGDSLSWNYSNLGPNDGDYVVVRFHVPLSVMLGDTIHGRASIDPVIGDSMPTNNIYNFCRIVGSSYDPNNKEVSEASLTEQQVITAPELYYTIHFQNTGTAAAYQVVIRDTLGPDLILPSIQLIAASHPYSFSFDTNGIANWTFDNIMLPDSGTDYFGSMGHVIFSIRAKQNLTEGDTIRNDAAIYFDLNPPVITNDAMTAITGTTGVADYSDLSSPLKISPNPTSAHITLQLPPQFGRATKIEIYGHMGWLLLSMDYDAEVDVSSLAGGLYFIVVSNEDGEWVTGRFVKEGV